MITESEVVAAARQSSGRVVSPLCAAPQGAAGVGVPGAGPAHFLSASPRGRSRRAAGLAGLRVPNASIKPGKTNIPTQYTNMTRVDAVGGGAPGSHPVRATA